MEQTFLPWSILVPITGGTTINIPLSRIRKITKMAGFQDAAVLIVDDPAGNALSGPAQIVTALSYDDLNDKLQQIGVTFDTQS